MSDLAILHELKMTAASPLNRRAEAFLAAG
jgi:hypothetical protein